MTAPDPRPMGTAGGTPQVLLTHHLKQLKLLTVLREYDKVARKCARDGVDHQRYLLRLIELELLDRERRTVERRIRAARFPATKSFDTFDFTAIPGLNKMLVLELARCEYILRRENIIALGNSGTGKTHVALALGLAACQKGFSVAFTMAASLVNQLMEARDERRLLKLQRDLQAVRLLIVDELGYVPLPQTGAKLLFEAFSQRYERGSTIVTSNCRSRTGPRCWVRSGSPGRCSIGWRITSASLGKGNPATSAQIVTQPQAGPDLRTDLAGADLRQGYSQPAVSPGDNHPD
jgi:DNA replication protein DnaC